MASPGFNIYSWNVNGLRTININDTLKQLNCAILAIQETKLSRDALSKEVAINNNFTSYFSFCRNRTGYSGVANYCRDDFMPIKSEEGLSGLLNIKYSKLETNLIGDYPNVPDKEKPDAMNGDDDGRSILTQHMVKTPNGELKKLTVINVYCPRLRDDPGDPTNNVEFKMTFHNMLRNRAKKLVEAGSFVIILGDMNICHKSIDRAEPKQSEASIFEKWMDDILSEGFKDTFRMLHPDVKDAFSCWCTRTNSRQNNYGARIDYIFVDDHLSEYLEKAEVHSDIFGSDHCPVSASFHSLIPVANERPAPGATKYYPEFMGKQTNLTKFFDKGKVSIKDCPSQRHADMSIPINKKRNVPTGGKQTDIKSFFVKKSKTDGETEKDKMTIQREANGQVQNGMNNSNNDTKPQSSSEAYEYTETDETSITKINENATKLWKSLMTTPNTPSCSGHNELCTLRTVKKKGLNLGRKFWACSRGVGQANDPNGNCNFFAWTNTKF